MMSGDDDLVRTVHLPSKIFILITRLDLKKYIHQKSEIKVKVFQFQGLNDDYHEDDLVETAATINGLNHCHYHFGCGIVFPLVSYSLMIT